MRLSHDSDFSNFVRAKEKRNDVTGREVRVSGGAERKGM